MADFIPHTPQETMEMLGFLGLSTLEDLVRHYPTDRTFPDLPLSGPGMTEREVLTELDGWARKNTGSSKAVVFRGAGAYDHFIPEAVHTLVGRGEFLTSYTPYQPEASQGLLQAIFEFQTAISRLFGMDLSNASLYDGATAAAEACLVAVRYTGRSVLLVSEGMDPSVVEVIRTYTEGLGVRLQSVPQVQGRTRIEDLRERLSSEIAGFIGAIPTFWGTVEDFTGFREVLSAEGALFLLHANPHALAILRTPGEWGADLATGEGQPLGIPLSAGGPYLGLMTASRTFMRRIPGRLVGQTVDQDGRRAFVLTLQAREQHIRREKANSNICSNETLLSIGATIYLSLLGPRGLYEAAAASHRNAMKLREGLSRIPGIRLSHEGVPHFHEFVVGLPMDARSFSHALLERGYLGGLPLFGPGEPEGENRMLWCATEVRTDGEIEGVLAATKEILAGGNRS
ncbi:MAG: aminomethyl-transferring glycine dehydrogenase subunit GcvPA [Nitrospirae bacterium]|jgi:glycine dehydrogenase subunit 1|nr:aminomethyl-transferring glycine dehydrogenase subunit GcvPA [Nitrospirota bacterium]